MYTLGINAALAEPSACLVKNGHVASAAEEDRFTRYRAARRQESLLPCELPFHAIDYCLAQENIVLSDVDHIAYSFDPYFTLAKESSGEEAHRNALLLYAIAKAPEQLCSGIPHHLLNRFRNITCEGPFVWHFVEHHLAHAANAFLTSPFAAAAVMTMGSGEETAASTYSLGTEAGFTSLGEISSAHSLANLCDHVAGHLGFNTPYDRAIVAELSAMGKPRYAEELRAMILHKGDGQYVAQKADLNELFGPPRPHGEPLAAKHFDIAASLQVVLQETALAIMQWLKEETGEHNACLAGDLASNIALNGFLRQKAPFAALWIPPAAGDAGTAVGAALWIDWLERGNREGMKRHAMSSASLGPGYSEQEILGVLSRSGAGFRRLGDVAEETAEMLAQGYTAGWVQGRMEFGPHSLGYRSILASPAKREMRARLNAIKGREEFRPCAVAVNEEQADDWFLDAAPTPFMCFAATIRPEKIGLIPACCHADTTAGVHTVSGHNQQLFHQLLKTFEARTGLPLLLHTSFNRTGSPVACTPRDALEYFWTMPLDALVIGPFMLEKPGHARHDYRQKR